MIRHNATIVGQQGSTLWVECERGGPCALCPGRRACPSALLSGPPSRHRVRVRSDGQSCRLGARVVIGIPEGALLRAALLAYALPLVTLLAGAASGAAWTPWAGGVGAVLGLAFGVSLAGRAGRGRPPDAVIVDRPAP